MTRRFLKCFLSVAMATRILMERKYETTLKGDYPMIVPLKFGDIPPSDQEEVWFCLFWFLMSQSSIFQLCWPFVGTGLPGLNQYLAEDKV